MKPYYKSSTIEIHNNDNMETPVPVCDTIVVEKTDTVYSVGIMNIYLKA